jgi:hypothetical protein
MFRRCSFELMRGLGEGSYYARRHTHARAYLQKAQAEQKASVVSGAQPLTQAVIRGYKGATLYTEPAAQTLEDLELVGATEPVRAGGGAGAGGGGGADGGDRAV